MKKITVLGAGSWGTAIAVLLNDIGHEVTLWTIYEKEAERLRADREQKEYLPGVRIDENIKITSSREEAAKNADIIVIVIPSTHIRELLTDFKPYLNERQILVNCSKGLEEGSLLRISQVMAEVVPVCRRAVLSGPSHAEEVSRRIPTTVVAASEDVETAKEIQGVFMSPVFRVYTNTDIAGVELGAALKNVIALAAGVSDGMGYGDNTKAALMTRGIVEIARLGEAMGADRHTFSGLSGIGDLIVTCTSMHSRNRRAGILLGQGKSLKEALDEVHMVVEGVNTAKAAYELSLKYNVEMPIVQEIYLMLFENKDVKAVVYDLMTRDEKHEHDDCELF